MWKRGLLLIVALAGAVPPRLLAQAAPPAVGDRVRIEFVHPGLNGAARERTFWRAGRFLGARDSTLHLLLERGDTLIVPRYHVRTLEVTAGKERSTARGLLIGALAGGLALGAAAAVSEAGCKASRSTDGWPSFDFCFGPAAAFGIGFALGAVPGAAVGGIVGRSVQRDRWERAPLPAAVLSMR